ncbi:MAG: hypothetical protein AVDCRST_MAG30-2337, partial [uncultured Solirubrobacteraceae bacterium]
GGLHGAGGAPARAQPPGDADGPPPGGERRHRRPQAVARAGPRPALVAPRHADGAAAGHGRGRELAARDAPPHARPL